MNKAQVLRVHDSRVIDTGRYSCMAVSIAGKATKNFNVEVYGAFYFNLYPSLNLSFLFRNY